MKKSKIFLLIIVCFFIFFLIYIPHYTNPFPIHIDEWHHISEALKLKQGEYSFGWNSFEIGFHIFLMFLSFFTNLVLIYKFLPALWAVFTALVLFFIIYKKTNNFSIGIFSMIFFASIKSNVNILGLWFFVPLTFAIPFIFLYIYFFTEGIQKQNKKYILISLLIMIFLIPTHSPSILFAIPFLIIFSLYYYKYLIKEYKLFILFLLIPVIGILIYSHALNMSLIQAVPHLINSLKFNYGWGVLELNNSFFEIYSLIGYILAIFAVFMLIKNRQAGNYFQYILWPVIVLIMIIIFKIVKVSYLSPYQRNIYYFIISLPFLSAIGLFYLIKIIKSKINKLNTGKETKLNIRKIIILITIIIIFSLTFRHYFNIPEQTLLYKLINKDDYFAIKFLEQFPKAKVLAKPGISSTIYPISGQEPITGIFFYKRENKKDVKAFFLNKTSCDKKQQIIKKHNIKYVLSKEPINCTWKEIYNKGNFIYEIKKH